MATNKKPKIAVIGLKGLPAYGGAAAVGENIINNLKYDYNFVVYSTSSHTNLKTSDYNGVKQVVFKKLPFPLKKINPIYYYFRAAFHCLFNKYDVIHLHHLGTAVIIPILKIRSKVIITSHGSALKIRNIDFKFSKVEKRLLLFSESFFLRFADIITSVSQNLKILIEKNYGYKVHYIPNGINLKTKSNNNKNNNIVFAANRIIPTKGCHIIIQSLKKINISNKLLIIGDLEHHQKYKQKLISQSIGLNVEFIGLVREKAKLFEYISKAQLFIYPSSLEAMSMMLLEVAELGIPIICSNIEENRAVFTSDEVLFFKSDNAEDLAEKLLWAEENLNLMKEMANRAKAKVEHKHLWTHISEQYSELYKSLI